MLVVVVVGIVSMFINARGVNNNEKNIFVLRPRDEYKYACPKDA